MNTVFSVIQLVILIMSLMIAELHLMPSSLAVLQVPKCYTRPSEIDLGITLSAMDVAEMLWTRPRLALVSFWCRDAVTKNMRQSQKSHPPGKIPLACFCRFRVLKIILFFSARKSAEVQSFVLLCQLPVPRASAVQGHVAIDLDYFTSFGRWVCQQIVLHAHQKISKFPEFHEYPADVPLDVFLFVENLAICFRPHVHPEYHFGLR